MRRRVVALAGIAFVALAAPLVVLGQTGALKPLTTMLNRPWPAPVVAEDESKVAPPLSPADAIKTFHLAPGYKLELVAAEPLTKDPILAEFDGDGRLWVVEMHGFSINEAMENSLEPIGEVAVLEDTNGDGVFDKRTVFMDKLVLPRAIKVLDKGCALIGEPPNLIKGCDTNGDMKADTRDVIDKNFGVPNNIEHTANGLYWGMDNTLVVSEHSYNIDFVGGQFKIVPNLRRGQWGVTQDDGGRIYRNVNTDPLFVDYVSPKYYVRNPNLVRTNGLYQNLVKQEDTLIWPVHPTRGVNRGYRADIFRADGSSTYYGGVSSPLIYRGDRLPKEIQGQPLVVDGPTNIVHLLRMTNDNGRLSAADFYKQGELIASTDIRFRPVQVIGGPDGAMYVIDMYRGISQDGPIQTDYLRDYSARRGLAKGVGYGRVYRLTHESAVLDPKKPRMSKETPAQLVAHLSHPNGWWRDLAQQFIVQRGDKAVAPALRRLAGAPQAYTRLHALWTLQGLRALDQATTLKALDDASPDVRAAAIRLSETWLTQPAVKAAVLKKAGDGDWFVRRQLAATLGELPADQRMAPIIDLLRRYGDDPILVDIAVSGLSGQEEETLQTLMTQPSASPDAVLALAGATTKGRNPATVQKLLALADDAGRPAAVRAALLKGAALGLQGAGGGGGGNAVVGGRAGGGVPGLQERQAGGPGIDLPSEPAAVTRIASGTGEVAEAARAVVALVKWPGKPAPPSGPARTPAEDRLFAAGKDIYANNCAACHAADGAGVAQVGAKLAGSQYVNMAGDGSIRILVNGKEGGGIGVMPPLGSAMSDEEVAAVLTFIRQSWGNTAPAIQTAQVKETRAAYLHRTTPWSEAELATRRR